MIYVIPISPLPEIVVEEVCRRLFLSYGIGVDERKGQPVPGDTPLDATSLLSHGSPTPAGADDKTLLLTDAPLILPAGPLGEPPSGGLADPGLGIAIVTTSGIDLPSLRSGLEDEEAWLEYGEKVARRALHHMGTLWGLRRCPDKRCAMTAPWIEETPAGLCDFCRGRSEQRIHLARS